MTFNDLIDFVENKMKLSYIYQPLLIKNLFESGETATIYISVEGSFHV